MSITGIGNRSSLSVQSLIDMRARLDDLQRQLATGQRATSYAGLGDGRGLSLGLRSRLASLAGFDDTITNVGVRLTIAQTALQQIDLARQSTKTTILQSQFSIDGSGQTPDQRNAVQSLDMMLGILNTQAGDRYLFSGSAVDQLPVETADHILNGDGSRAGLRQIIAERQQADLGANGLGRVRVSAHGPRGVALSEDVDGSPFGFKLVGVATTVTGAAKSAPSGSPPRMWVNLGTSVPNPGETVSFTLALPDGTSKTLTLTATAATTPGPNEFAIGADSPATAANLRAALADSVRALAGTSLKAASAVAAGNDFFNTDATHPPQRVSGSPLTSATALVDGTASNTVAWYKGEAGATPARQTSAAQIDPSITASYGMRANEEALRLAVQGIAVFAATSYAATDTNAEASYGELKLKLGGSLDGASGQQRITDIQAEIAGAQTALVAAKERHQQTRATLGDMLTGIEGVSNEEVAAQILALQTSLQASLQTTAMMYQTSILNYI